MGVNPTPTNYKAFTFDGKSSREFGVYITGTGVFNSPERDVEMISIPARNGAYALDKGRFNNIEVTYDCGIVADTDADFSKAISDFRNWLCSRQGYCRLVDEYNPDEYRMGLFREVVEVEHEGLRTGEFEITFDCKPQRWLTSGETAVTVADGGTIDNPTLFDSSPLLEVDGYGNIGFNGYNIEIISEPLGLIMLDSGGIKHEITLDNSFYKTGDAINIGKCTFNVSARDSWGGGYFGTITVTTTNPNYTTNYTDVVGDGTYDYFNANTVMENMSITAGTAKTENTTTTISGYHNGVAFGMTSVISIAYAPGVDSDTITLSQSVTVTQQGDFVQVDFSDKGRYENITVNSTETTIGNPVYIDCDIGECYKIKSGSIIPLNAYIDLGSDLPTLASGTNTFNYDNTVTDLKVVPRWWRV